MHTLNKILSFKPQISDPKYGPEPSLAMLVKHYYASHGYTATPAKELTERYIQALATEFKGLT